MESRTRRAERVYVATVVLLIGIVAMTAAGQERPPSQNNGGQTVAADWVKFSPEGARFSLLLPGLPAEKTYDGDGGLKAHHYKLRAGAIEYQVVWFEDAPGGKIQRTPLSALFPLGLNGILTSARQDGEKEMVISHQEDIK
ncbi:MAG TPA: hypothetical protein VKJ45_02890, partial [Blastocatellia bacterium]|nr:hypothetical protein [Blastocatellia bacterium]